MGDELAEAVSFANGYFSLVDGLAADLNDYLAEDVILDWFGQTVEGRANVVAFMKHHKIDSRHVFNDINPVPTIGYRKQPPQRRKYYSLGALTTLKENEHQMGYKRKYYSDVVMAEDNNSSQDSSPGELYNMGMESEISDTTNLDINFDLSRLKLNPEDSPGTKGVTPKRARKTSPKLQKINYNFADFTKCYEKQKNTKLTNVEDMERKIMELKEKKICRNLIEKEIGQGDSPIISINTNSMKYIETCGVIEFSRIFNKNQIRKEIRKRYSRLQIAYSIRDENSNAVDIKMKSFQGMELDENSTMSQSKLMNSTGIYETLIPNIGKNTEENRENFGGERSKFFDTMEDQMKDTETNINDLMTPKYVKYQFITEKCPEKKSK